MADDATLTISKENSGYSSVDVMLTKVQHNVDKMLGINPIPSDSETDTKTLVLDLQLGKEAITFTGYLQDVYSGATWDLALAKKNRLMGMFREPYSIWTFTWGTGIREQIVTGVASKCDITENPGQLQSEKSGQVTSSGNTPEVSNKIFDVMIVLIKTTDEDALHIN